MSLEINESISLVEDKNEYNWELARVIQDDFRDQLGHVVSGNIFILMLTMLSRYKINIDIFKKEYRIYYFVDFLIIEHNVTKHCYSSNIDKDMQALRAILCYKLP